MSFFKGYRCVACGEEQAANYPRSTCSKCGGNLDVQYDYAALRRNGKERLISVGRPDLFRYARLLPVKPELAPPLRIGMTPLHLAERLAQSAGLKKVYLKDDGLNPSASFKDRASAIVAARAREIGAKVIAGASTGNAGSSMACLAASLGMPCVIFVPEKAPPAKIAQLLVFGAKVIAVRGTYDNAFDLCLKVAAQREWFSRNTGFNPFTREGKKTCSFEICEQLGWNPPDRIVVPTGDGNIISGIWKGIRDLKETGLIDRVPKIDCAQSAASSAVSRTIWKLRQEHVKPEGMDWSRVQVESVKAETIADSISVDQPRDGLAAVRAVLESGGEACTVTDDEILAAIPEIARLSGVFAEPAAATTWACLKKMAGEGLVKPDERVVCVITGSGLKDIASARRAAGEPIVIDAHLDAANRAIESLGL